MSDEGLDQLLAHLRDERGFDFTGYKPSSLQRRLRRRMESIKVEDYDAYVDYLEVHPDEFAELFDTILINVTAFFRDTEAWDVVAKKVVPAMLDARQDGPIRIWSAGCASGQEAFSIAMLLAEAMGEEQFLQRVKIYGTDVDEQALEQARAATFDAGRLEEEVPEPLRDRYFEASGVRRSFRKDLRRAMIFGRNNLVQDAPISRIDLLLCRNTLMYFNSETQSQVLRRLHFALQPSGNLFLGKSEMLLSRRELFEPIDLKCRIFTKVVRPGDRRGLSLAATILQAPVEGAAGNVAARALEVGHAPQMIVDHDRRLLFANDAARRVLRIRTPDLGRPLQDLEVSYRPAELRAGLDTAFVDGKPVTLGPVTHRHDGASVMFEVLLSPIAGDGAIDAVSVTFLDVTELRQVQADAERSRQELDAAYEELQSAVEELETTNEELQSTNEELETTNEELQSTNEELETMNEELASSNEELETMNDELRLRSLELREGNAVMDAILRSKGVGVMVVDQDERVRLWSQESEELWGVRSDEATGSPLRVLDIGLPLDPLRHLLHDALRDDGERGSQVVDAVDRRGRSFRCAVTAVPMSLDGAATSAAIVLAERLDDGG